MLCLFLGLIWFSTKDSCLGTLDNSNKRAEIQVRKMVNFTTPIVPQPQNRDFGDASLMNSTLNSSRKRLLPENDDESRVAKHGKFEELPGAVNYGVLTLQTGVHMLQGGGFGGFESFWWGPKYSGTNWDSPKWISGSLSMFSGVALCKVRTCQSTCGAPA